MNHAPSVLGIPVLSMINCDTNPYDSTQVLSAPVLNRKVYTTKKETRFCPAMLWPNGADLCTVYIEEDCLFVQASGASQLHLLQTHWNDIQSLMPCNSICHCVVYENNDGNLSMGVYDVLRLAGEDLSHEDILKRHARLHTLMQDKQQKQRPQISTSPVLVHWVGYEDACVNLLSCSGTLLPFQADKILRVQNSPYSLVLKPILIEHC